jgi:hypothetical protein
MNPGGPQVIAHYREYLESVPDLKRPPALEGLANGRLEGYDAVFLPGGHGPIEYLAHSEVLGRV